VVSHEDSWRAGENSARAGIKPFEDVTVEEYFEFSKAARLREDKAGVVDALSNAKRCFHYQVDRLLYRYGLRKRQYQWHLLTRYVSFICTRVHCSVCLTRKETLWNMNIYFAD
jgi:hypothetical protein